MDITYEREEDGRWLAIVETMPGVMAYGATKEEAAEEVTRVYDAAADASKLFSPSVATAEVVRIVSAIPCADMRKPGQV